MVHNELCGVLVTFRRPLDLAQTMRRLADQTRRFDTLVVVDNDNDPRVAEIVATSSAATNVIYLPAQENLGPAGGLALGMTRLLRIGDDGWVVLLDDDDPPRTDEMLAEITSFADEMLRLDSSVAGVGLVGARFDVPAARTVRIEDHELHGPVVVDYIGGGQLPCYRAAVMREVGVPEASLFFGFDDLEYGLRLKAAGHPLYIDGDTCLRERKVKGLLGIDRQPRRQLGSINWRNYYTTRNLIWILRTNGHHRSAVRVVAHRILAKGLYNLRSNPTGAWAHSVMGIRAALDAYTGRMGRTVEPAALDAPVKG